VTDSIAIEDRSGHRVRVTVGGRVNLIGDHVDYMGGPVLPMAIDLGTTIEAEVGGKAVELISTAHPGAVRFPLPVTDGTRAPGWARYPVAVAAELHASAGLRGTVSTTLPTGAGLSSSAALEVAVAMSLGAVGSPDDLAHLCQRAEHRATGVPSGIMDQLSIIAGHDNHATLIDCATLDIRAVVVPPEAAVWVVHSGDSRQLGSTEYAQRREQAEQAAAIVGALPTADANATEAIADPVLRRRARHVRSESGRVLAAADALEAGDLATVGRLMSESHRSLRDDYEVSTPALDALVERLTAMDGVFGARLTGAGFGGCVVALASPEVHLDEGWRVRPSEGVRLEVDPD